MARWRLWIGASAADAGMRLAAQMLTTIIVARLLSPEDFGVALMVLSVVAIFGTLIGQPVEEAMAQRHHMTLAHVRASLFVSLALTLAALLLAPLVGFALTRGTGDPRIGFWFLVAAIFLIGEGPGAVARALARRHRRFVRLSICQSASVVIASGVALATASLSPGVFVLILQRMLPSVLFPLLALALAFAGRGRRRPSPFVWPAWHAARFRDLLRFSWLHLATLSVGAVTPAALAYTINAMFGTATLGQLNIALRIVDPLRQLIGGIGHNLVVSMLYRMQSAPAGLVTAAAEIVASVGILAVPAFLGLAVCAPVLLPLLVGPGWEEAVPLSRALCLGAVVYVPFGFLYSGFSALGRPEYSLIGDFLHLVLNLGGLWIAQAAGGAAWIGAALVLGDVAATALAIGLLVWIAGQAAAPPLARVARIWSAAALMAISVDFARLRLGLTGAPIPDLALLVLAGAVLYPPLLFVACRSCFDNLRRGFRPKRELG
jgi:O-antigen/teichoic acid export membrane protein